MFFYIATIINLFFNRREGCNITYSILYFVIFFLSSSYENIFIITRRLILIQYAIKLLILPQQLTSSLAKIEIIVKFLFSKADGTRGLQRNATSILLLKLFN